ncbi:MAG: hypothetical protein FWD68_07420 [Alphaproteobacteria bacterium]|nr:hypothetical protein [Alphaproteobacteria bacterium]
MKRTVVKVILAVLLLAVLFMGRMVHRWYDYVTAARSPYDEVGIDLNTRMPFFMRKWGCYQLQKRFGDSLPPHGCTRDDGRDWM